jgi:glycosyltransferase involved in cell wall biosynthesis
MKRVVLVTAHFPPSNLVGVHRARIWANYLPEFGWEPTILTAHWKHYEENLDWGLMSLVGSDLDVVRTKAFGTKPVRLLGNMALRAMWWSRKALDRLIVEKGVDFVHIVLPDHFSALLGPRVYSKYHVPYGFDYSDPWVHDSPRSKIFLSKAWVSCCLSYVCEPWAVRHAKLLTGVSQLSFADVIERNPSLKVEAETAVIPMANSARDFLAISGDFEPAENLFDPDVGTFNLIYAGAMPPRAFAVLDSFLAAVRQFVDEEADAKRLRISFVGTGRSPDDPRGHTVKGKIDQYGLSEHVVEYPIRISYLDVLWHLRRASAILILGSTERHYTPSKVFQSIQSGNPVLALLHKESTAVNILRESGAGRIVDVPDSGWVDADEVKRSLKSLMRTPPTLPREICPVPDRHSAREGTRLLAKSMEAVLRTMRGGRLAS